MDFGASVRRRRRKLGLTIAQLAERAHLSVNWVSEVERGREPSLSTVFKLAKALEVPPGELLSGGPGVGAEAAEAARLVDALPDELRDPLLQFLRRSAKRLRSSSSRVRATS